MLISEDLEFQAQIFPAWENAFGPVRQPLLFPQR